MAAEGGSSLERGIIEHSIQATLTSVRDHFFTILYKIEAGYDAQYINTTT